MTKRKKSFVLPTLKWGHAENRFKEMSPITEKNDNMIVQIHPE